MIKSMKLKFVSTCRKSIARIQRFFFHAVFDVCFYQRSRFSRDFFASSKFVFVLSSLTLKNVSIFVLFFFRALKIVRTFLRRIFCVVVVLCVVVFFFDVVFDFFSRFVRVIVALRVKFDDVVVLFFSIFDDEKANENKFCDNKSKCWFVW